MVVILKPGAIIRLPATTKKLLFPPLSICFQSHLFFEKRLDWELTGSSINSFHPHLVLKCLKLEQLFVHIFFRKILLDCLRFPLPCFILLAEVIPKTMRQIFSLIPFFIKAFATLLDSTFWSFVSSLCEVRMVRRTARRAHVSSRHVCGQFFWTTSTPVMSTMPFTFVWILISFWTEPMNGLSTARTAIIKRHEPMTLNKRRHLSSTINPISARLRCKSTDQCRLLHGSINQCSVLCVATYVRTLRRKASTD